ncbi:hypothetical protein P7C70_g3946, partial [Phenoliferia sp. Uapishka_3]
MTESRLRSDSWSSLTPSPKRIRVASPPSSAGDNIDNADDPPMPLKTPSSPAPFLLLPDDVLLLILHQLTCPLDSSTLSLSPFAPSPHSPPPAHALSALSLTHSHFLHPIRALIYNKPNLDSSNPGDRENNNQQSCSCKNCQVGRSPVWQHAPIRKLAEAVEANPALGSYVKHLDRLGEVTVGLSGFNIAPSLVSRTVLGLLERCPNIESLDIPLLELRNQGDLIHSITLMSSLRRLKLGVGCATTKDGTSMLHEGDLRRIARSCPELESLEILTPNLGCGGSNGWVEPFPFHNLRTVKLVHATSLTDRHLSAMLSGSKQLQSLTIIKSAGLDGTSGTPIFGSSVSKTLSHRLTTTGIASILSTLGRSLRHLHIDVSDRGLPASPDSTPHTIPSIQSALLSCPNLTRLTLNGPGLILANSLPTLGSPTPAPPSRYPQTFSSSSSSSILALQKDNPSLSLLTHLSIGLYPPSFPPLLAFLSSLPSSPSSLSSSSSSSASPFSSLQQITITNPPQSCTGHEDSAVKNVEALRAAVGVGVTLILTTPAFDWGAERRTNAAMPFPPLMGGVIGPA